MHAWVKIDLTESRKLAVLAKRPNSYLAIHDLHSSLKSN